MANLPIGTVYARVKRVIGDLRQLNPHQIRADMTLGPDLSISGAHALDTLGRRLVDAFAGDFTLTLPRVKSHMSSTVRVLAKGIYADQFGGGAGAGPAPAPGAGSFGKKAILGIALLAATWAAPAFAADSAAAATGPAAPAPSDFDVDGVPGLSATELATYRRHVHDAAFARLDFDRDGDVSELEVRVAKLGLDAWRMLRHFEADLANDAAAAVESMVDHLLGAKSTKAELSAYPAVAFPSPLVDSRARATLRAAVRAAVESVQNAEIDAVDAQDDVDRHGVTTTGVDPVIPLNVADRALPERSKPKPAALPGVYLRRDRSELAQVIAAELANEASPAELAKAQDRLFDASKGALVSYTRDEETGDHAIQVKGALGVQFSIGAQPFVASVEVDRNEAASKPVDSLVGRVGTTYFTGTFLGFENSSVDVVATYSSDHRLRSGVYAGELDWEPTIALLGTPIPRRFDVPVLGGADVRLRPRLHAEFGRVHDAGDNPTLDENDGFVRWGPVVSFEIRPIALERLSLSATYKHLESDAGSGHAENSDDFTASLGWALSPNMGIDVTYRNGVDPLTGTDSKTWVLGLTYKF